MDGVILRTIIVYLFVSTRVFSQTTTSSDNSTLTTTFRPSATTQVFIEKCLPQCRQFLNGACDQACQCTQAGLRDIMDCLQCQVDNLYFESQAAADARFESINATCTSKGFPVVTSISSDASRMVDTSGGKSVVWTVLVALVVTSLR